MSISRASRYPKEKVSLLSAPLQENIQFEKYADSDGTVSLADLEKIVDMKGNKKSALAILSQVIRDKQPEIVDVLIELKPARQFDETPQSYFDSEMREMKRQFKLAQNELKASDVYAEHPDYSPKDDLFKKNLQVFVTELEKKMEYLDQECEILQSQIKAVYEYFAETTDGAIKPEEILAYIKKFMNALEKALKEEPKVEKKPVASPVEKTPLSNKEEQGHLDNLLDSLKNKPVMQNDQKKIKRRDIEPRKLVKKPIQRKISLTHMDQVKILLDDI